MQDFTILNDHSIGQLIDKEFKTCIDQFEDQAYGFEDKINDEDDRDFGKTIKEHSKSELIDLDYYGFTLKQEVLSFIYS
jgi:hypothetical protein